MKTTLNKNYKLIAFDWDGTLIDSRQPIIDTMQQVARELSFEEPSEELVMSVMGLPLNDMLHIIFSKASPHKLKTSKKLFYDFYVTCNHKMHFFEGALETLAHLREKGYKIAIATNKIRPELVKILDYLKASHFFDALRCGDDGLPKPHPEMLLSLLEEFSLRPDQLLMIGDTEYDMMCARDAKVDVIAACCGAGKKETLAPFHPIACIHQFQELMELL